MMNTLPNFDRILVNIAACNDIDKLTKFMANARRQNADVIYDAALKKLKSLTPRHKKGSYERLFWDMLFGYQAVLLEHGKPSVKLNKAMKLALSEGEILAHAEWLVTGSQAWALRHLHGHSARSKTAEAVALKFPDIFDAHILQAASRNLQMAKATLLEMT